jgi:hypothetical protein
MKYVHRPMTGRLLALVLLACPSMPADSEPHAEVMTPLLLGVQDAPIPFLGSDGQIHLVYELWITNFSAREAVVETAAVVGDDKVLETLDGAAVANRLQPAGRRDTSVTMAPSTQALLFLHVVLPTRAAIPRLLSHRISVRVSSSEAPRQGLAGLASLHVQRKDLCLLKTSSIGGLLVISDPKSPGIITFFLRWTRS